MSTAPRQHTPGPWDAEPKGSRHFVDGPDGLPVAYLARAGVRERAETEANALLIPPAPELLAALEAAAELAEGTVKLLRQLDMESGRIAAECVLRDARAAISRATGGNAA